MYQSHRSISASKIIKFFVGEVEPSEMPGIVEELTFITFLTHSLQNNECTKLSRNSKFRRSFVHFQS